MCVPTRLDAHHHRSLQSLVESPRFFGMQQPAFDQLARFLVQHCYHLKARMKITAYILHIRPPSSRALGLKAHRVYSRLLGALVVIQSKAYAEERIIRGRPLPSSLDVLWHQRRKEGTPS